MRFAPPGAVHGWRPVWTTTQAQLAVKGSEQGRWRWRWRSRIRGGDLEPPPGGSGDCADLGGDFCEILILAEYRSDVELAGAGHADEVEGKAEVDALSRGEQNKDALGGAVLGGDGLRVVSERTRRHVDARTAHGHEARVQ